MAAVDRLLDDPRFADGGQELMTPPEPMKFPRRQLPDLDGKTSEIIGGVYWCLNPALDVAG